MPTVAQIEVRKPSSKNAVRRRLRFAGELEDGQALYQIKSRTTEGTEYHPAVDLATGHVMCDCKHFEFRCTEPRLGHAPSVADADRLCHHLQRCINEALRHGRF